MCDYVLTGDEHHLATLTHIDAWLLELARPEIFDDGDARNVLVARRRSFGQLCAALADAGFDRAGQLTTFEFQSAIEFLKEKHTPRD